jgi:ABC-type lipoprotein export system ATPase subunit
VSVAIDVRGAFRIYGSQPAATVALAGLDLSIERGELVVVLGPSGSGKTTLLRVVGALERLSAGSARVLDVELAHARPRDAAAFRTTLLGFLEQHYARALSNDLSVRDTVALRRRLRGDPRGEAAEGALELLGRVGLADRADERPQALSGGEQQRVAVCAAIAHGPALLLADEPAGELDTENAAIVYRALAELTRERGTTALVVSHDREAAAIADRVVYIRDGRIVAESRRGGAARLVVSRKGWLQVPNELLSARPNRASVERRGGEIVLTPEVEAPPAADRVRRVRSDPGAEPVAELRGVARRFGARGRARVVLEDFSRSFRAGTLTAVVGRSGSGKTTLLHLLAGLERPTSGEVRLVEHALAGRSRSELAAIRRRTVALVTQEPGLVPYLTALENVELGLSVRGAGWGPRRAREALAEVGLGEHLHRRVSLLSAGERERVAIARALAVDARLLLVDEPTARLDEETARLVGAELARAAHERGLAVVCATHDAALIELADEIVALERPADAGAVASPR